MKYLAIGVALALGATLFSYGLAFQLEWIKEVNWVEAAAVFTAYISTYLCVVQSRINYIFGIISTCLFVVFFLQLGLLSSAALNIYMPLALLYGWLRWGPDDKTRAVSWLGTDKTWFQYIAWSGGVFVGLFALSSYLGTVLPVWDASIVGFTVLAQLLLDNKRMETWFVWVVVNCIAIWVYFVGGAPITAVQYIFFLANTVYGFWMWKKDLDIRTALNG